MVSGRGPGSLGLTCEDVGVGAEPLSLTCLRTKTSSWSLLPPHRTEGRWLGGGCWGSSEDIQAHMPRTSPPCAWFWLPDHPLSAGPSCTARQAAGVSILCAQGSPGTDQMQEQMEGRLREQDGAAVTKFRACSCGWSPAASRGLVMGASFQPTDLSPFRGRRGLQASQAQLGSLQW